MEELKVGDKVELSGMPDSLGNEGVVTEVVEDNYVKVRISSGAE